MAEYKNGVSALGNVSVSKEDTAAEVRTGRVVFVDEDKYENDAAYKAKVDKCIEEGFMRSDEAGSSASGGGTPLIVSFDRVEREDDPIPTTYAYYDKTWQEVSDALVANRPVYIKYGKFNTNNEYIEDGSSLIPIFRASNNDGEYAVATLNVETASVKVRELEATGADEQIRLMSDTIG